MKLDPTRFLRGLQLFLSGVLLLPLCLHVTVAYLPFTTQDIISYSISKEGMIISMIYVTI